MQKGYYSLNDTIQKPGRATWGIAMIETDRQALFEDVYSDMRERIYFFIYHRVGRRVEITEDLTQEVFTRLWVHLPTLHNEQGARAWLYRVALNAIIDYARIQGTRQKRTVYLGDLGDEHTDILQGADSPESDYVLHEAIKKSFASLPVKYREILILSYIDGYSLVEISEIIQRKYSTVKMRAMRARQAFIETYN